MAQIEMDAEMKEICKLLQGCILNLANRPVWHENRHAPYYSRHRWQRVA